MNEKLRNHLREVARDDAERAKDDTLWLARAAGTLPAEQEAALSSRAETDDEAAFLRSLTAKNDSLDDRILGAVGARNEASTNVVPLRRRTPVQRALVAAPAALAVAAALVLWFRLPARDEATDLPPYAMTIGGADVRERGTEVAPIAGERAVISTGARVEIVVRPKDAVARPVRARALIVRGAEHRELGGTLNVAATGAVRIEGAFGEVFGDTRGDWDLVVLVAPSANPVSDDEVSAALAGRAPAHDVLLRKALTLVDAP